jgi:hypothetical protein
MSHRFESRRMRRGAILAAALTVGGTLAVGGVALGDPGGGSASGWHVGYYTPSGRALSMAQAPAPASGGIATLNFTNQANTALLVTGQSAQYRGLVGDMTGKSVTASFTVSGLTGSANYYGEPDACGGTTAYVRYFFETSNAGGFNETHYWWSNPVAAALSTNGTVTLPSVPLTGANWSDYYGHFGNDPAYSSGFDSAVGHVTQIGLSFGGGCFFENGVGTTDGSGTFTLNSYTAN